MKLDTLVTLALHFSLLSFLAIGGAISALPEMHRQAVDVSHWMTDRQFIELVAIAQAAPVPALAFHPVAKDVGNVRNQGPQLIVPVAPAA